MLDFNIVKRQIIGEYIRLYGNDRKGYTWSLGAVLDVFRYFYNRYYQTFGTDHPHMKNETIRDIIERLPCIIDETNKYGRDFDVSPEDYEAMIDGYFDQEFANCNYSIAHFMSGDIRTLRYYENIY